MPESFQMPDDTPALENLWCTKGREAYLVVSQRVETKKH